MWILLSNMDGWCVGGIVVVSDASLNMHQWLVSFDVMFQMIGAIGNIGRGVN